jgi:hypothetical protein
LYWKSREEHENREDDDHDRRHVDEEVVEREAGPTGDDDVGRITDQGGRTADVGGQDLSDDVGLSADVQSVADHDGHRHDEHDDRDVIQDRGGDRGDQHQHDHQPVRAAL